MMCHDLIKVSCSKNNKSSLDFSLSEFTNNLNLIIEFNNLFMTSCELCDLYNSESVLQFAVTFTKCPEKKIKEHKTVQMLFIWKINILNYKYEITSEFARPD